MKIHFEVNKVCIFAPKMIKESSNLVREDSNFIQSKVNFHEIEIGEKFRIYEHCAVLLHNREGRWNKH